MNTRETIYQALFSLVTTGLTWRTSSRRLEHWSNLSAEQQPALFLVQKGETAIVQTKIPTKWELRCELWLYANTSADRSVVPMSLLNPLIDAIVNKLVPPGHIGEQTLNGLVERCRIDGQIETDEGVLGDQAVVIIPVTMFVPQ